MPKFSWKDRKKPLLSEFWNTEARMDLESTECKEGAVSHVVLLSATLYYVSGSVSGRL